MIFTFARRVQSCAQHANPPPVAATARSLSLPYHVVRNTRGSLPVYSDLKRGNKYLVLVRNIQGNPDAMLHDLHATLFQPGSEEAAIFRGQVHKQKHLILQGPGRRWKVDVMEWLTMRGF